LPLIHDVFRNAFAAAFHDARFPSLTNDEFARLTITVSVLSRLEELHADSEAEAMRLIVPEVDGLALHCGQRVGVLLPAVWKMLPNPQQFLQHLRRKAGLAPDFWSDQLRLERFTTQSFGGQSRPSEAE
jgi:AmmeMemoRadiSam system protein A